MVNLGTTIFRESQGGVRGRARRLVSWLLFDCNEPVGVKSEERTSSPTIFDALSIEYTYGYIILVKLILRRVIVLVLIHALHPVTRRQPYPYV